MNVPVAAAASRFSPALIGAVLALLAYAGLAQLLPGAGSPWLATAWSALSFGAGVVQTRRARGPAEWLAGTCVMGVAIGAFAAAAIAAGAVATCGLRCV